MIGGPNIRKVRGLSSLERMIDVRCHGTVSVRAMSRARVRCACSNGLQVHVTSAAAAKVCGQSVTKVYGKAKLMRG